MIDNIENLDLTKQRRAVLEVIRRAEKHLSANDVFEEARALLPSISFATVYNSLRFLKNEGFIGEIQFGNKASLYDRNLSRHDHAVCSKCGTLVDIEMEIPADLLKRAAKFSKFKPESMEFTLRGLCPECV